MKVKLYPIALLLFCLSACYEQQEGCLDLLASNYQVSSDQPCDDCCTYPKISLEISHLWNEKALRFGDTLNVDAGTRIILLDQAFYLSEPQVTTTDGIVLDNRDFVSFTVDGQEATFGRDIIIIKKTQTIAEWVSYRSEGAIDSINFRFGLPNWAKTISLDQGAIYSPLQENNRMTQSDSTRINYRLQYLASPSFKDTIKIVSLLTADFKLEKKSNIKKGQNIIVPLSINYNKWFENIDFSVNATMNGEKIAANATKAIN